MPCKCSTTELYLQSPHRISFYLIHAYIGKKVTKEKCKLGAFCFHFCMSGRKCPSFPFYFSLLCLALLNRSRLVFKRKRKRERKKKRKKKERKKEKKERI
jgi:hypothetical protein